ncbi:hypothetical protein BBO99_00006408 [Phytophthora kernoviae]|uniref:Catalase n=2 Tax=Phytophthora kernoviae TaxID=325452 RepID=A0A3R7MN43_9STRA|nr:hypothetical protein G195_008428 [Phytophthora kernoviae 00238/432]KAG2519697.1 hypothetical protein JM16_007036 [Phytophthora kernoviae]RLN13957.1 hypothetical protein BBI17_006400 [Phytophthora kernoviae]RLN77860.1 hypothetical protein BBO99_00006408 [Phytophthora kernoviae]
MTKKSPIATTSNGTPLPPNGLTASATAGPRGPMILEDFAFIDHMAHFDRERIPERVVHAKGGGAFGYFEVTHSDITQFCSAKLFSNVGKRTPVAIRFSTVGGELGSADTVRDPRGFAIKFYTEEGNWDLVGNNTPIFFIRDPILFPSFIHTQKRLPSTHLKDDDMMWDFFSLRPETLHQQSFLFADRGIPDGFRFMNGYGSHTFANVNAKGEVVYVKYHFKTDQGIRNLPVDKAAGLASSDPDYAIRDLYEAIANKQYPCWTLYIQVMTPEQAAKETTNPFDVTKIWSHKSYPLIEVGRLVLNRNPTNYFAEIEQLAFSPSHMVPGVEPSPDKMLQGRLFSYPDTQRHRLGVNYNQIPVNRPLKEPQTYQRDGFMAINGNMHGVPNYFPNSKNGPPENKAQRYHAYSGDHAVVDKYSTRDDDNFSQVGEFYRNTLDLAARERLTDNISGSLVNASQPVQARAIANFTKCDPHYGRRVQEKVAAIALQKQRATTMSLPAPAKLNPVRKPFVPVPPSDDVAPRFCESAAPATSMPEPTHRRTTSELDMRSMRRISDALLLAQNRARLATDRANHSEHLLQLVLAQVNVARLRLDSLADWELLRASLTRSTLNVAKEVVTNLNVAMTRHTRYVEQLTLPNVHSALWSPQDGLFTSIQFMAGLLAGVVVGVTITKQLLQTQQKAPSLFTKLAQWCSPRAAPVAGTPWHLIPLPIDDYSYLVHPATLEVA